VSTQTVANCWIKAGILPTHATAAAVLAELEAENEAEDDPELSLSNVLDELQSLGVLQKGNRLDILDLVETPEEQVAEGASDEEIFDAVTKMRADQENKEINGGNDGHNDLSGDPKPSRKEAIQAASMLRRYLGDVDGSFARNLEHHLAKFGRETQAERTKELVSTSITDFFTRK
jgi:hypothetical protein